MTKKITIGANPLNTELIYLNEDDKPSGSLLIVYFDKIAWFYAVEIIPSKRNLGYGKKIIYESMKRCVSKGMESIQLNCAVDNLIANTLYQSIGFQFISTDGDYNNYEYKL